MVDPLVVFLNLMTMGDFFDSVNQSSADYKATINLGSLANIVGFVFNVALGIGVSITIVSVAYGFFLYVTSRGEKAGTQKAHDTVTWSIMGMGIVLLSWTLKKIALSLLGASDVTPTL